MRIKKKLKKINLRHITRWSNLKTLIKMITQLNNTDNNKKADILH